MVTRIEDLAKRDGDVFCRHTQHKRTEGATLVLFHVKQARCALSAAHIRALFHVKHSPTEPF